jgi:hypothetical protein
LSRTPFDDELERAKEDGKDFAISAELGLADDEFEGKLDDDKGKLGELGDTHVDPSVGLADEDAKEKLDDLRVRLDELKTDTAVAKVDVDDRAGLAKIAAIQAALDSVQDESFADDLDPARLEELSGAVDDLDARLSRLRNTSDDTGDGIVRLGEDAEHASGDGGGTSGLSGLGSAAGDAGEGMGALGQIALATAPMLVPIGAAALGALGGLTSLTAGGVGGLGIFALAAGSAASTFETQADKILKSWQQTMQPFVKPVFADALKAIGPLLQDLDPVIAPVGKALDGIAKSFSGLADSAGLGKFIDFLQTEAPLAIDTLATAAGNLGSGLAGISEAFAPFSKTLAGGIDNLTGEFAKFGQDLSGSSGFKSFMDYIHQNGPLLSGVFEEWASFAGNLVVALAPLGTAMLKLLLAVKPMLPAIEFLVQVIGTGLAGAILILDPAIKELDTTFGGLLLSIEKLLFGAQGLEAGWDTAWHAIDSSASHALGSVESAVTGAMHAIVSTSTAAWSAVSDTVEKAWGDVKSDTSSALSAVTSSVQTGWSDVQHAIGTAGSTIESTVTSMWSTVRGEFTSGVSTVVSALASLPGDGASAVSALGGDLESVAQAAMGDMAAAVSTGIGTVVGLVRALPGDAVSAVGNLGDVLFSAGEQLIDGFGAGVEAAFGGVLSKVHGLISDITHLHASPSVDELAPVVMQPAGRQLMEGLAKGILDGGSVALSAVHSVIVAAGARSSTAASGRVADTASGAPSSTTPSSVTSLVPGTGPALAAALAALNAYTTDQKKALTDAASDIAKGLKGSMASLASYVSDAKGEIDKYFKGTSLDSAVDSMSKAFNTLDKVGADSLTGIAGRLKTAQTALASIQSQIASSASSIEGQYSIIGGFQTAAQTNTLGGALDITSVAGTTSSAGTTAPVSTGNIISALRAQVADLKIFGNVLSTLKGWGLAPELLSEFVAAGPAALPQAQALLAGGKSAVNLVDALQSQVDAQSATDAALAPAPTTSTAGTTAVTGGDIISGLQAGVAQLKQYKTVLTKLKSWGLSSELLSEFVAAGPASGMATAQALLSGGKSEVSLADSLQRQIDATSTNIATLSATATIGGKTVGLSQAEGIVAGLKSNEKTVTAQLSKMAEDMQSVLSLALDVKGGASGKYKTIGGQMIAGLTAGIQDANSNKGLESELETVAKSMESAIKKALGISSPSTVFAAVGTNIVAGLAQGITGSTAMTDQAIVSLYESITAKSKQKSPTVLTAAIDNLTSSATPASTAATQRPIQVTYNGPAVTINAQGALDTAAGLQTVVVTVQKVLAQDKKEFSTLLTQGFGPFAD